MSSFLQTVLINTLDLLQQIDFSGVEFYEPVNMFDTYIVLASFI
jgi:hypothetical protein